MICHIAICDDNPADSGYLSKLLDIWAMKQKIQLKTEIFPSSEAFLFRYAENKNFHIILLDIEMDGMDGVTLAKQVRQGNEALQIIFITGYSDYIAEGYEVAALHYLMKPLNEDKFYSVMNRAVEKVNQNDRCLNLNQSGEMVRIPLYEIRYLDVRKNYVTIHCRKDYTVKQTLNFFEKELDNRFYRVGRSLILNLNDIRRITKTEVHLLDGTALALPRGAYEPLNRAVISYT